MTAYCLWVATVALLTIGTWLGGFHWMAWGLGCSAAAATATIRQYAVNTNRLMRLCFEHGRDQGRADTATATPLRPPLPR